MFQMCLTFRNRHRAFPVNLRLLRRIAQALFHDLEIAEYDLAIHFVGAAEMTRLNETFLHHQGSTDVITFDYAEPAEPNPPRGTALRDRIPENPPLHGEIFICLDEAVNQARRF